MLSALIQAGLHKYRNIVKLRNRASSRRDDEAVLEEYSEEEQRRNDDDFEAPPVRQFCLLTALLVAHVSERYTSLLAPCHQDKIALITSCGICSVRLSAHSYPALQLVPKLVDQRCVQPGPLVTLITYHYVCGLYLHPPTMLSHSFGRGRRINKIKKPYFSVY